MSAILIREKTTRRHNDTKALTESNHLDPPRTEQIVYAHLTEARTLFCRHGKHLLAVSEICRLLKRYDDAITHTQQTMGQIGVGERCAHCARETGSCCFQEVETWYDETLLLINLLLNTELPQDRVVTEQCFFLGNEGCRLRARYAFCLNYFCPFLKEEIEPGILKSELAAVGHELALGWELERAILQCLPQIE